MIAKIITASIIGLDAAVVEVEADVSSGLPSTVIVGLPDTAVQESRERVKSALRQSDCSFPVARVAVNLAPADLQKTGTHFDLPIALAILLASDQVSFEPKEKLFLGELSLDGHLRPVPGVLAVAILAKQKGIKELYVPKENMKEAALVGDLDVCGVDDLKGLLSHLLGINKISPFVSEAPSDFFVNAESIVDFLDIAGHSSAKRALEIACSGGHNVLMNGAPGSGKTLLARSMSGILPALALPECLELTKIYSIAGLLLGGGVIKQRPVRSPHHTTSSVAIVGGGTIPKPGEVTLAHRGILFLDEFPEFSRSVLEALRQPLEDGVVTVSRARSTFTFPAKFILVAARNPCPCGYFGDSQKRCICAPGSVAKYQKRISGPLLDRIDLHVDVPRLSYEKFSDTTGNEPSAVVRSRVEKARQVQMTRLGGARTNSELSSAEIKKFCKLEGEGENLLKMAAVKYHLSGRGIHRILKVARTIADLAEQENILAEHVTEAIQYRSLTE